MAEFEAIPGYIERFAAARETADEAVQLFLRHVRGKLELFLLACVRLAPHWPLT